MSIIKDNISYVLGSYDLIGTSMLASKRDAHLKIKRPENSSWFTISLFTWSKQKWLFWSANFYL